MGRNGTAQNEKWGIKKPLHTQKPKCMRKTMAHAVYTDIYTETFSRIQLPPIVEDKRKRNEEW